MIIPTTEAVVTTGTKYIVRYNPRLSFFSHLKDMQETKITASSKGTIITIYLKLFIKAFQNKSSCISSL